MNELIMSPQVNEIFAALGKAQAEMHVAQKDSSNPYHKSKYANIQSVFKAIKKPLSNNGLCISQLPFESGENAVLITILGHTSGQWLQSRTPIKMKLTKNIKDEKTKAILETKEFPMDSQEFTSAITYARRSSAAAITGCYAGEKDEDCDDSDDDGNSSSGIKKGEENVDQQTGEIKSDESKLISEKQCKKIFAMTVGHQSYRDILIKKYGSLSKIPANEFNSVLQHLEEWLVSQSNTKDNKSAPNKKEGAYYEDCPF